MSGLTVEILGHRYAAKDLSGASRAVSSVRDNSGMGYREMGGEFPVRNSEGEHIAIVSYNGKVWTPEPYPKRTLIAGAAE